MEQAWNDNRKKLMSCLIHEEAQCTSSCPFHLDVRAWIEKMQEGRFNAAYRLYLNTVGFPGIVSETCPAPCRESCLMQRHGGAIRMRELEQAALAYNTLKPNRYSMPKKKERIAVVGGGMSGLGCALRLCNRKYDVTVFERSDRFGGQVLSMMPPEQVRREIENQFQYESCHWMPKTEITDLHALEEYDAVYLAAGAGAAHLCPPLLGEGKGPFATSMNGVFVGGAILGADHIEALAQGMEAAALIEGYLKSGVMRNAEARKPSSLRLSEERIAFREAVSPANGTVFSEQEAVAEAKRCEKCKCDACMKGCGIMKAYSKTPIRVAEEVDGTLHPGSLGGEMTLAMRFLSSCNQCDYCVDVCPQKINVGEFLQQSRALLREKDKLPWAFFDYWIADMEFSCRDASVQYAGDTKTPDRVFFPGCQMGASDPEYVLRIYEEIKKISPHAGILLGCCGAPALWGGAMELHEEILAQIRAFWREAGQPEFIVACPTCEKQFRKYLPEIRIKSVYVLLDETQFVPLRQGGGEVLKLFDPCAARENEALKASIRHLAARTGYVPEEWEGSAVCCSYGGNCSIANPEYAELVSKTRAEESPLPYLTYCVNCRDVFASRGKSAWHILDILFARNDPRRPAPGATQRRQARRMLQSALLGTQAPRSTTLIVEEQAQRKMDEGFILLEDIERLITEAEQTNKKIIDVRKKTFTCYGLVGRMTYWAEYRVDPDGIHLLNVYGHRMQIKE